MLFLKLSVYYITILEVPDWKLILYILPPFLHIYLICRKHIIWKNYIYFTILAECWWNQSRKRCGLYEWRRFHEKWWRLHTIHIFHTKCWIWGKLSF